MFVDLQKRNFKGLWRNEWKKGKSTRKCISTHTLSMENITKTKHTISFNFNNGLLTLTELELGGPEPRLGEKWLT